MKEEIISDEDIIRVHAHANFGGQTPRQVVDEGVKKYAVGFSGGFTMRQILIEHGLLKNVKGYNADLSAKGKKYARALFLEGWQ